MADTPDNKTLVRETIKPELDKARSAIDQVNAVTENELATMSYDVANARTDGELRKNFARVAHTHAAKRIDGIINRAYHSAIEQSLGTKSEDVSDTRHDYETGVADQDYEEILSDNQTLNITDTFNKKLLTELDRGGSPLKVMSAMGIKPDSDAALILKNAAVNSAFLEGLSKGLPLKETLQEVTTIYGVEEGEKLVDNIMAWQNNGANLMLTTVMELGKDPNVKEKLVALLENRPNNVTLEYALQSPAGQQRLNQQAGETAYSNKRLSPQAIQSEFFKILASKHRDFTPEFIKAVTDEDYAMTFISGVDWEVRDALRRVKDREIQNKLVHETSRGTYVSQQIVDGFVGLLSSTT